MFQVIIFNNQNKLKTYKIQLQFILVLSKFKIVDSNYKPHGEKSALLMNTRDMIQSCPLLNMELDPCTGYAMLFTAEPFPNTEEQCPDTFTSCARPFSCSSPLLHVMRFVLAHSIVLQRLVFF